jgi:ribose/xylose/arabinose/galactoside ABC-type transport system permease subunit
MVRPVLSRFLAEYGMVLVLLALCGYYSVVTYAEQDPGGAAGGEQLAHEVARRARPGASVLIVARDTQDDATFAATLRHGLTEAGLRVVGVVKGQPADARAALQRLADAGEKLDLIAAHRTAADWAVLRNAGTLFPGLGPVPVVTPQPYSWPNFLKADNLLNVANQIVVIAVVAVGMTLVVITGGIDLSVGSLIALSAVVATWLIREVAGAETASPAGMVASCLGGIAVCTVVGLFSAAMVTVFRIPPFIVTLSTMLVASGLAFMISENQSIYQLPDSFVRLGRGADLLGVPNAVLVMVVLYAAAHVVMTRMTLGRYIYAVGGNAEAARLSGVPVRSVLLFAYATSGALAGLGGVIMASQLKSGSPTYGQMYELYVIAAVVVGGTSLAGGEGNVLGTLIGAFVIAVIQNGMNLTGVESNRQKVVLGLVILAAVLADTIKKGGWRWLRRRSTHAGEVGKLPGA